MLLFASPDLINDDPTQFSTGIMHIDNDPNIDSTASFNYGKLTQWTLSLDAFNGQTIFVAFLHDSDDDFYLGLDDVVITQESTLPGVDELSNRVNVKVFPNPASDLIKVEFEAATSSNFDISIVSIEGKIVYGERLGNTSLINKSIDVSELPAGTYFVHLRNEERTNVQKFTVTR
ncbi:MAG: T9SS type A sorting domain-containing protein [Flavobacteriales bacterium]|nr:T9SS type A sorting domain-containing protein [Flavobacteriales bacterium]